MTNLVRSTIATLAGLAFQRATNLFGPGAFDVDAFDSDAFDVFDGGAIDVYQSSSVTGVGLTFTRATELE